MARRLLPGLERVLGVNALFATAYGNVGSSIYYALGLVASYALGLTPIVFLISGVLFYLTAATYSEATSMYPEAGGSSSFARRAFNEFWSFFAAWGQMLNYTITIAISAFFVPHYIGGIIPGLEMLRHAPGDIIFGIAVVILLSLINIVGVKEAAGLNIFLAVVDFATQLLLVIAGVFLVLSPETLANNVQFGIAPTWTDFAIAIPVGMIAYTGIETISNMAEEAKKPGQTVPRAINMVVIAVFAIYAILPAVALSALPVKCVNGECKTLLGVAESDGGYAGDPILGVVKQLDLGVLQTGVEVYVGLLAATILFIAANAGIIGVSRLVYSMGLHRQLPDRLRQLHPTYRTPWIGILLFGAIACVAIIPGQAAFLGNLYAFGAMLSFTIAHAAVVGLRLKHPDVERPYSGPGNITLAGRRLPLFALVGGLGTLLAWVTVTLLHVEVAAAGLGWLVLGLTVYFVYRRSQGLDLTSTVKAAVPEPAAAGEAEYESVLVALEGKDFDPELMSTAKALASGGQQAIHVLVLITVPAESPLDVDLPAEQRRAEAVIEEARVAGGRRVGGHWERIRAGQAGRRIVDVAREIESKAIVLPLRPRAGAGGLGRTLESVIADRPCRVIVQSLPVARSQSGRQVSGERGGGA
ncbi:MAG: universal stress protein [Actinomycetes bacterium]